MRVLVVNPNISEAVSALIEAEAVRAAALGTEIVMRTARLGVEYIETRFESLIGAYAVAEIIAEELPSIDAVIVAAFGDPGLLGLREVCSVPVVGVSEAAMHLAALQAGRIGVVAISNRITAWYREAIAAMGLADQLVSIRNLDEPIARIGAVQLDARARLEQLIEQSAHDGADVVVLAGAPLAGLARRISGGSPIPVIDGIAASVVMAEAAVRLGLGRPRAGSFAPPPSKQNRGLTPALKRLLDGGGL